MARALVKGMVKLAVLTWAFFASYAGTVWIDQHYLRPDLSVVMVTACGYPGTVIFVRADGEMEFLQPGTDDMASARILERASHIRIGHKYIIRSACPTPSKREST